MAGLYTAAVIVLGLTIYALVPALASLVTALANLVFGLFQLLHQLILLPVKLVLKGTCLTPVCACALSDRCGMPPSHHGNPSRAGPVPRVHLPRSQIAYVFAPSVFYSVNADNLVLSSSDSVAAHGQSIFYGPNTGGYFSALQSAGARRG